MKKIILCISCIVAILFLSGCSMDNTPTKKVENFLDNYKNQDETVIDQLDEMVTSDDMMNDNQRTTYTDIMKRQYEDLTYEIKDEVIDGDTATVTVEIEVYDYYKINQEANQYYIEHPNEFGATGENNDNNDDEVGPVVKEERARNSVQDGLENAAEGARDAVEGVTEGAENVIEGATDVIVGDSKYIDYRLGRLNDAKDRVTYTIDFTLTKVNDVWTLNEIDDVTRQKIHGLYSH